MAVKEEGPVSAPKNLLSLNPEEEFEFQQKVRNIKSQSKKHEKLTPGVICLRRIPQGFYEKEIREYFSQFGKVVRLRLSRSKKTGRSKGYAFLEFECDEVAKIVADTMNNYLIGERLLKCNVIPPEKVHPTLFKGCNTIFKKPSLPAVSRYNKVRTAEQNSKMTKKLLQKEHQKRKRLAGKGIDYDFPGFAEQIPEKKKPETEQNTSVNSEDTTPLCTPSVLERRKSMVIENDDSDEDDEIIINYPAQKKLKGEAKKAR
uniref:Nucleolar protein interacting with the FHA domain of MKI67 n=1 Tax=Erpetoichthys calabaricus TaxID=27687 RepID=A0A8C4XED1_ERPCA